MSVILRLEVDETDAQSTLPRFRRSAIYKSAATKAVDAVVGSAASIADHTRVSIAGVENVLVLADKKDV